MLTPRPASSSTRQLNTETHVVDTAHGRILAIADIRGRLSALNDLAREHNVKAVVCTGDFGFFESASIDRINDRTLRHLTMYSPLISSAQRSHLLAQDTTPQTIRATVNISLLSEFPLLLSGQIKLQVPVYTVWGACEDVAVLEKFRLGTYKIENLHVIDEATTRCIDIGGIKLRLLGIGGALVPHKFFDNGEGKATIAGAGGTVWATALQIGELVDTAQRVFDPTETRVLITHASPGREGIMSQLALVLKADLTISAGLHFRYATSYNEFSVQPDFEGFRHKLELGKEGFDRIWENVKQQVDAVVDENQKVLLDKALSVVERLPNAQPSAGPGATATGEEPAWKNCWNWNLCDAAYGSLVFDIKEGRMSSELKSQGFNYAYRRTATLSGTPNTTISALPNTNQQNQPPSKGHTPAPQTDAAAALDTSADVLAPTSPIARTANGTPNNSDRNKKKDKKQPQQSNTASATPKSVSTPIPSDSPSAANTSSSTATTTGAAEGPKSPVTEHGSPSGGAGGIRTPRTGKPQRHPWTIFMRLQAPTQETFSEAEVKEFFKEASEKIMKIHWPNPAPNRPRFSYIEFEDEEAMKLGLEKHAEKLKDHIVEVKQATDRESRGEAPHRGGPGGRGGGRGRGSGGGGYAARGFAAAGLTGPGHRGGFGRGSGGGEGDGGRRGNNGQAGGDA